MLPPTSILAAVDFSDSSRTALRLAARLALRCHARLHVLHVEDPLLVAAAAESGFDLTADTRSELRHFIGTAPEAAQCAPCRLVVVGGPATAILQIANREHADLVVLSAHGMSGPGRLLFGSVTQQVLLRADRSVLVVPDAWTPPADANDPGLGPIVVGIDYTEPAIAAATAACALATLLQTTVEAVHVVPSLTVPERWKPHAERVLAERVSLARRDLAQLLAAATPAITLLRVEAGDIAEELAAASVPIGTRRPLLVLGRRSTHAHEGVPGATAQRVATIARAPLLMHQELPA